MLFLLLLLYVTALSGLSHHRRPCLGSVQNLNGVVDPWTPQTQVAVLGREGRVFADWTPVTSADGSFTLQYSGRENNELAVVVSRTDATNTRVLVSVLGKRSPNNVVLNSFTTVASAYALAQFASESKAYVLAINGDFVGTRNAGYIASGVLINSTTGQPTPNLLDDAFNGQSTTTLSKTRLLAELVNLCTKQFTASADCRTLLLSTARSNAFFALQRLATSPATPVEGLGTPYTYADWTLPVLLHDTGSALHLYDGPGAIAFDLEGNLYITNNNEFGSAGKCSNGTSACPSPYIIMLAPDGEPLPSSPFFGPPNSLIGTGWGVSINHATLDLWVGSFQDLSKQAFAGRGDPNAGFMTHFAYPDWTFVQKFPNNPPNISGVQGINSDLQGNVFFASLTGSRVCRVDHATHNIACVANEFLRHPFDVDTDSYGNVWAIDGNMFGDGSGSANENKSYAVKFDNNLNFLFAVELPPPNQNFSIDGEPSQAEKYPGTSGKAIVVDAHDNAWASCWRANSIACFTAAGLPCKGSPYVVPRLGPWGASLDGKENIYLGGFGEPGTYFAGHSVAVVCGASDTSCTMGTIISTEKGWGSDCNCLTRITDLQTSSSGALWVLNNFERQPTNFSNPGGHTIAVMPGLAVPPKKKLLG